MALPPVGGIVRLRNPIKNYRWGSRTVIAQLLGRSVPSSMPEAELWIGAHPNAPSMYTQEGVDCALDEAIARDPDALLGEVVARRFSGRLPFLVKILAADAPLSLQLHPDEAACREGFERENRAQIPIDAPNRSYRDARSKPELISALTPFDALVGFREPHIVIRLLEALRIADLGEDTPSLELMGTNEGLIRAFRFLYGLPAERAKRTLGAIMKRICELRGSDPAYAWVSVLHERYPGDTCVLAPLFLNLVHLDPGQAVAFQPGEIHAYLRGAGIEVTGNSDNVIRAGLTTKHVDATEFFRRARFSCKSVEVLNLLPRTAVEFVYRTGFAEFEVRILRLKDGEPFTSGLRSGPEILVCTRGRGALSSGASQERDVFEMGAAFFICAGVDAYRVEGEAELCRVCVPSASAGAAQG